MRWLILLMSSVLLEACAGSIGPQLKPIASPPPRETTASSGYRANLPDLGEAPELNTEVWLNTDQPLRLGDLRGKVVLIDMWTFG